MTNKGGNMADTFSNKTIRLIISLGAESFSGGGSTKTIEGLACQVTVQKPGLPEKNSASAKVWGLPYEDLEQLTMLAFLPGEVQHNTLEIHAGDAGGALSMVFTGEITSASADFNASPDISMQFEASSGFYPQLKPESPLTVEGEIPAAELLAQFAASAGYTFTNEGVESSVVNAWYHGSPIAKMCKLADDVGCELIIDNGCVIALPPGQARSGGTVLLNAETGLIGYPTFTETGISCRCLYNPALIYGGLIKVESIVPKASAVWRITKLSHSLSAYCPSGGLWESQIEAARI